MNPTQPRSRARVHAGCVVSYRARVAIPDGVDALGGRKDGRKEGRTDGRKEGRKRGRDPTVPQPDAEDEIRDKHNGTETGEWGSMWSRGRSRKSYLYCRTEVESDNLARRNVYIRCFLTMGLRDWVAGCGEVGYIVRIMIEVTARWLMMQFGRSGCLGQ